MATSELGREDQLARALTRVRGYVYGAAIFTGVYLVYLIATPINIGSQHHIYLAQAMLNGNFDVGAAGMPRDYVDTIFAGNERFIPFPPGPAVLLMPFVAIWGTDFSQSLFAATLGAINVVIFWQVLVALGISRRAQWLAVPFFAFGTVHFYAATEGAVWQYNHVAAVFFMLVAVLLLLKDVPLIIVAFVFGFAVISRSPVLMAAPFFLYYAYRKHHEKLTPGGLVSREALKDIAAFSAGLAPFALLTLGYNYARFGNPFDSGYAAVYQDYVKSDIAYTYYRDKFPDSGHFNLFDLRNIPLHIHALFLLPPSLDSGALLKPSPYGMSVLLTSPAFVYAFLVRRKTELKLGAWLAIGLVCAVLFTHYSQGWVQFGYRFLLDFAPFLLILTAMGFDDNDSSRHRKWQVALVSFSIVVSTWGVLWARQGF